MRINRLFRKQSVATFKKLGFRLCMGPVLAGAALSVVLSGFTDPASVSVHQDVVYATVGGAELHLDVYEPVAAGPELRPSVILIHGGGWISLDKRTMSPMGRLLAGAGYVAFSVDYRLFGENRNRWPAQLEDVQRAVRWIRANATTYRVNPDRIGAFGHSAGAQLAALLGMEDTGEEKGIALPAFSSKVQAVVDYSGPSDFTRDHDRDGDTFFGSFLGSTKTKAWQRASPVFHVAKDNAPFLIVHGTRDPAVPISQSEELYQALRAAGVPVEFVRVDDVHTFQTSEARRQLAFATVAFFHRYLVTSQ